MTKTGWIVLVFAPLLIIGAVFLSRHKIADYVASYSTTATTTPALEGTPAENTMRPYGKVTLGVGETAVFPGSSITLLRVYNESRCPEGVTCVWEGTVTAEVESVTGTGTSTERINLGKFVTTESTQITFLSATPYPKEGVAISPADYQITFDVGLRKEEETHPPAPVAACYTGGCSGEVCSDQSGIASNCIYKPEFACYKKSKCERQRNGQCGWTQTQELKICLANPPQV